MSQSLHLARIYKNKISWKPLALQRKFKGRVNSTIWKKKKKSERYINQQVQTTNSRKKKITAHLRHPSI